MFYSFIKKCIEWLITSQKSFEDLGFIPWRIRERKSESSEERSEILAGSYVFSVTWTKERYLDVKIGCENSRLVSCFLSCLPSYDAFSIRRLPIKLQLKFWMRLKSQSNVLSFFSLFDTLSFRDSLKYKPHQELLEGAK